MTRYAENTKVSSAQSRAEIEQTLTRYDADGFMYGTHGNQAMVAFQMQDRHIRFKLTLPDRTERRFTHHSRGAREPEAPLL